MEEVWIGVILVYLFYSIGADLTSAYHYFECVDTYTEAAACLKGYSPVYKGE